jgi:hypothetical protein
MSNITPISPETEAKPRRARRKREPTAPNTFDMPNNVRLTQALHGVCKAMEEMAIKDDRDFETSVGLATAAAILSQMVQESLTNQSII